MRLPVVFLNKFTAILIELSESRIVSHIPFLITKPNGYINGTYTH